MKIFKMIIEVISALSTVVAMISVAVVIWKTKRNLQVSTVSVQRLQWAESVRIAVSSFINAFYDGDDLRKHSALVFLYLNPNNNKHKPLIKTIENICKGKENKIDGVIANTQKLLRENWWAVKAETKMTYHGELKREKNINKQRKLKSQPRDR